MTQTVQILKFGGSSLGVAARLRRVLDIVASEQSKGPVALVVSAIGDTTDHLLRIASLAARGDEERARALIRQIARLAKEPMVEALSERDRAWPDLDEVIAQQLSPLERIVSAIAEVQDCSPATRDLVLSFGERLSAVLVAGVLRVEGHSAVSIDARAWVVTDDRFGDATVLWDPTLSKLTSMSKVWADPATIPVHTGFVGATVDGKTTTLGRNGSDYTAAILGRALGARWVTIWTDVSGVMTADPGIEAEAYTVPSLSYREGLELAGLGLRMFHPRTIIPLLEAQIPMQIRNVMRPDDPGTTVDAVGSNDARRPTCIASIENMTLIDIEGTPRSASDLLASRALEALGRANIPVWFATQAPHGNGIALSVRSADGGQAVETLLDEFSREIDRGHLEAPRVHKPVSLITLVAEAMGKTVNVAGRFFGALGAIGVNVRATSQGATSRAITCVVDAADTEISVRAVHAAFNLAREQVNVLLLGKGTVGTQFLTQLAAEQPKLKAHHELDLRLVAISDHASLFEDSTGIDPRLAKDFLSRSSTPAALDLVLDRLSRLPVPVLVDCTAADGMELVYAKAFAKGVHVVTANKKPLAIAMPARAALFSAAHSAHRGLRYETTVGASLPVIETLKNLVRTGDRVLRIEGSFSGTLGYLANEVSRGVPLSKALREARERGFTEPHPRDDLSGIDAARKALILARELGLSLDLEDVEVEPFVPASLLAHDNLDLFLDGVTAYDDAFEARIALFRAEQRVLRYLAIVDPTLDARGRPSVKVAPVAVSFDHPASRLRGTEAMVAFTTERYHEYPLVVQGAGAGGAVTAAGVLADVLTLSQTLRGR